jgi:hypothetical protein
MYSLYSLSVPRRAGAAKKKTPPTTVRLTPDNNVFVRDEAESHPDGQSGVLNDAVTEYRLRRSPAKKSIFDITIGED